MASLIRVFAIVHTSNVILLCLPCGGTLQDYDASFMTGTIQPRRKKKKPSVFGLAYEIRRHKPACVIKVASWNLEA